MTILIYLIFAPILILVGFVLFDFIQHVYEFLELFIESSFYRILIIASMAFLLYQIIYLI